MENRTEWLKKWFWKKFVRKGFSVELDAEYTFPFGKDSGKNRCCGNSDSN